MGVGASYPLPLYIESVNVKNFYYYYSWIVDGVLYHTTIVCKENPAKFMKHTLFSDEWLNEFFLKQFKTEEEMKSYWDSKQ